jgi:hypothetical protein
MSNASPPDVAASISAVGDYALVRGITFWRATFLTTGFAGGALPFASLVLPAHWRGRRVHF